MQRVVSETRLGDGSVRYKVTLRDTVDTAPRTHGAMLRQHEILRTIEQTPALMACGYDPWETLRIYHDGQRWVAEAEAVVRTGG